MSNFELNRFRNNSNFWPIVFATIGLLILLFLVRTCKPANEFYNGNLPNYSNIVPDLPEAPNRPIPIDTSKIILPDDPLKKPIVSDLLNVYLKDSTDIKEFSKNVINTYSDDSLEVTYFAEAYKRVQFRVPEQRISTLKKEIKEDFSSAKFVCYETVMSNNNTDPGFSDENKMWFYEQIGVFKAWKQTKGDSSIKIAVIDDSFDLSHEELKNQYEHPWNVFEYSDNINTYNVLEHGTHVAGSAIGELDNGYGISGVAPNCKLIPVQIADNNGSMTTTSILDGIFYALKNDADIINLSLGADFSRLHGLTEEQQKNLAEHNGLDEAAMWNEVYEIADKEGVAIVQAAGNSSLLTELDPMKRSKSTIVVGATDRNKNLATFTNYGEKVDIYAPGVDIYSSVPNQKYTKMQGTSMSSPIVAGCVGLIKSKNKNLSILEIKDLLQQTGEPIGSGEKLIQIDKILNKITEE